MKDHHIVHRQLSDVHCGANANFQDLRAETGEDHGEVSVLHRESLWGFFERDCET